MLCLDRSPLPKYVEIAHVSGYPVLSDPYMSHLSMETPGVNDSSSNPQPNYLSFAPPEVCGHYNLLLVIIFIFIGSYMTFISWGFIFHFSFSYFFLFLCTQWEVSKYIHFIMFT